jgi:hypothetical protein
LWNYLIPQRVNPYIYLTHLWIVMISQRGTGPCMVISRDINRNG